VEEIKRTLSRIISHYLALSRIISHYLALSRITSQKIALSRMCFGILKLEYIFYTYINNLHDV